MSSSMLQATATRAAEKEGWSAMIGPWILEFARLLNHSKVERSSAWLEADFIAFDGSHAICFLIAAD